MTICLPMSAATVALVDLKSMHQARLEATAAFCRLQALCLLLRISVQCDADPPPRGYCIRTEGEARSTRVGRKKSNLAPQTLWHNLRANSYRNLIHIHPLTSGHPINIFRNRWTFRSFGGKRRDQTKRPPM